MLLFLVIAPEPEPSVSPMPDVNQVADFSAAISGLVGAALLVIAGLAWKRANAWFAEVIADVKATKADAKAAKVQTTNSHSTNLRDDLTEAITTIAEVASTVQDMKSSIEDMQDRTHAMHEDLREARKDVRFATEYTRDVDKRLIRHMDQARKEEGGSNG